MAQVLGVTLQLLRYSFFIAAVLAAVVVLLDWLVRTRRINPFGPVARFSRKFTDPAIAPIERAVVRAGGLPTSAPWWALVAIVVGGLVILYLLEFLFRQLLMAQGAVAAGPRGILLLLITWTFAILKIALILRVVSSWLRVSPYAWWIHWSYRLTEPILRPLRGFIPPLGMIDITPLVAYFVIILVERLVVGLVL